MFTVDGFKVSFQYEQGTTEYVTRDGTFQHPTKLTYCHIENPDGDNITAVVKLFYKDHDNKAVARKYALAKALNKAFPGNTCKQARAKFWKAYFNKLKEDHWIGTFNQMAKEMRQ